MKPLLVTLRPKQWVKNLVVFAGIIFSRNITNGTMELKVIATFIAFCAVVSAGYIFNDILDRECDRSHPTKKDRPIASGAISVTFASVVALVMAITATAAGYLIDPMLTLYLVAYVVLQLSYSLWFKHMMILDVMSISAGFVIRAAAGAAVIHVPISAWLVVCTMLLAMFLALAKRRAEIILLEDGAVRHRRNLDDYSLDLLDQMTGVIASATLVSYALYTFTAFETSRGMMLTIPFVLYGIFRYLYLVHKQMQGGSPEQVFLTDKPLLINVMLWVVTAMAVLHWIEK